MPPRWTPDEDAARAAGVRVPARGGWAKSGTFAWTADV